MDIKPKAQATKAKIKQVGVYKTKQLLHWKENSANSEKIIFSEWKKMFTNYIFDKRVIYKI